MKKQLNKVLRSTTPMQACRCSHSNAPLTIREVEQQIDQCERLLSVPQSMATWSKIVSIYNALKIKYCKMKGESPIVTYFKPEHII